MTIHTRKVWEMALPMAFQAEASYVAADQQKSVWRSMRGVATAASFKLLHRVFENPGTSFFGVAFIANVGVKFIHFSQAGPCPGPVRRMAIGALQRSLDDAMVVGKIELRLDIPMTGEAEIRVFFLQEMAGNLRRVNLMAAITTNSSELMDSSFGLKEGFLFLVARQAGVRAIS
jgi:hypothetical protein